MAEIKSARNWPWKRPNNTAGPPRMTCARTRLKSRGGSGRFSICKGEEVDLEKKLAGLPAEGQASARQAMKEVFLRNIILPREEAIDARVNLAMAGVMTSANNKKAMARVKQEVEQLMQQFLMSRNSAYQQLKNRFGQTLGTYAKALEAQLRSKVNLEVEHIPEFQQEWHKFEANIVTQFEPVLEDRKQQMLQL